MRTTRCGEGSAAKGSWDSYVGNRPPLATRSSLKLVVSGPELGKSPTSPLVISSVEVREDITVSSGQRCLEVSRGRADSSTVVLLVKSGLCYCISLPRVPLFHSWGSLEYQQRPTLDLDGRTARQNLRRTCATDRDGRNVATQVKEATPSNREGRHDKFNTLKHRNWANHII
jgi:hypothetical protein